MQETFWKEEKIIKIPIYNDKFKIVLTDNLNAYLDSINYGEECPYTKYVFCKDINTLVCLNSAKIDVWLIVHEAFHFTKHIMDYVGCKLTNSSEEAYAYLIQYLSKTLYETIKELKNKHDTST